MILPGESSFRATRRHLLPLPKRKNRLGQLPRICTPGDNKFKVSFYPKEQIYHLILTGSSVQPPVRFLTFPPREPGIHVSGYLESRKFGPQVSLTPF